MLGKVLKKAGLGSTAVTLLAPPMRQLGRKSPMTAQEADALLCAHSPDPRGSAFFPGSAAIPSPDLDLDIIVPVYNVERYLPACIESILRQETDYRFRAIFVDDGSTDASGSILDEYPKDPRMLIIHQENQGLSGARNTGIGHASGAYLLFVDSDDYLAPGAVQAMLSAAFSQDAALVQGCFSSFTEQGKPRRELSFSSSMVTNPPMDALPGYAWGKLFRRDYFEHLRFPVGYWYEDSVNAHILFPMLQRDRARVVALNAIVYFYRENPQGISRVAQGKPKALDSFWITKALFEDRSAFSLESSQWDYDAVLNMILLTYQRTQRQPTEVRQALMVQWDLFLRQWFPGFRTERKPLKNLERALSEHNFPLYSLCCQLL